MDDNAEIFKLEIDGHGKQILVFRGISHAEFKRVFEAMQEWRKEADSPIFCIRINVDQAIELVKLEE